MTLFAQFGKFNYVELFTVKLNELLPNWSEYIEFCHNVFLTSADTLISKEAFEESGVLSYWISSTLAMAESEVKVPLNDRVSSMVFVAQIWLQKSDFVNRNFPDLAL
jgi:hypothetical protein